MVSGRGPRLRRSRELAKIVRLPLQHSSADCPSLVEGISGKNSSVIDNLYSVFTSEPLHDLHSEPSGLLTTCLIQNCHANTRTDSRSGQLESGEG